jgi:hypothetical protein
MEATENTNVGVCGASCLLIGGDAEFLGTKTYPETHEECVNALWYRNPFCHSATLIRSCALELVGGYDESFDVAQDWELWFRLGRVARFYNLQDYLIKYRIWRDSVTFEKHRNVVRNVLRARRLARTKYGYQMSLKARLVFFCTWFVQFLPPIVAHRLFDLLVLKNQKLGPSRVFKMARQDVESKALCPDKLLHSSVDYGGCRKK